MFHIWKSSTSNSNNLSFLIIKRDNTIFLNLTLADFLFKDLHQPILHFYFLKHDIPPFSFLGILHPLIWVYIFVLHYKSTIFSYINCNFLLIIIKIYNSFKYFMAHFVYKFWIFTFISLIICYSIFTRAYCIWWGYVKFIF